MFDTVSLDKWNYHFMNTNSVNQIALSLINLMTLSKDTIKKKLVL